MVKDIGFSTSVPQFSNLSLKYLAFSIMATVFLLIMGVDSGLTSTAYNIYLDVAFFTIMVNILAILTKNKFAATVIAGKPKTEEVFLFTIIAPIVIGSLLILFNTAIPLLHSYVTLSFPALSIATSSSQVFQEIVIVVLIAAIFEESFRTTVTYSFMTLIKLVGISVPLIFFGIVSTFILINYASYYLIGVGMIVLGLLFYIVPSLRRLSFNHGMIDLIISGAFGATVFGIMHLYAYGELVSVSSAIMGAVLFGFLMFITDWIFDNSYSSIIVHSMANALAVSVLLGINILIPLSMSFIGVILIYIIGNPKGIKNGIKGIKSSKLITSNVYRNANV